MSEPASRFLPLVPLHYGKGVTLDGKPLATGEHVEIIDATGRESGYVRSDREGPWLLSRMGDREVRMPLRPGTLARRCAP